MALRTLAYAATSAVLLLACGTPNNNTGDGGSTTDGASGTDVAQGADAASSTEGGAPSDSASPPAEGGTPGPDAGGMIPADPALRTQEQVCGYWTAERAAIANAPAWMRGATMCDPGTLPQATQDAAVRGTNLYRWLVGLNNVPNDPASATLAQACAVLEEANNMLSHTPPMSWTCYSANGAMGAGTSNITSGGSSPVAAVDGWIDDSRDITMTLGHRRWMLYPPLGPIGYGQATRYACLRVLGTGRGPGMRPWVAWPNQGPTPSQVTPSFWSFSSSMVGSGVSVAVTKDGAPVTVQAMMRTNGYGDNTVSWSMAAATAGSVYHVTVSGLSGGMTVAYDVRPVRCP